MVFSVNHNSQHLGDSIEYLGLVDHQTSTAKLGLGLRDEILNGRS